MPQYPHSYSWHIHIWIIASEISTIYTETSVHSTTQFLFSFLRTQLLSVETYLFQTDYKG